MADETKPVVSPPATANPTQTEVATTADTSVDTEMNGTGDKAAVNTQSQDTIPDATMQTAEAQEAALMEAKIPSKKDATLREFIAKMDDHAPIIPDAVINYYLTLAGLPPPPATPLPLARLLALATQKFIADVAADAYQYSRIRANNTSSSNPVMAGMPAAIPGAPGAEKAGAADKGDKGKNANLGTQRPGFGGGGTGATAGRTVLTMEDLGMAVGEFGVNVRRGEFYR
ncbi:transcription initiation factor IID, TAF10 subunit [Microthyrium microscopicum]|uniref:Transcription initiation factor TFIID subunit 10 n=1 Tax=Microthyrium microscopicum TaxID=703497 RepID=A0A6A6U8C0_9PEZI|nr:transcription initiation factor IID, TAF10 subunit [Microthyrium microscopicum]